MQKCPGETIKSRSVSKNNRSKGYKTVRRERACMLPGDGIDYQL